MRRCPRHEGHRGEQRKEALGHRRLKRCSSLCCRRISRTRKLSAVAAHLVALALYPAALRAQPACAPAAADNPFSRRGWHLELSYHAAAETWNYNISREEMHGINAGLTYGLLEGLVLTARAPLYYVNQRGIDGFLLGATIGVRGVVYRHQRLSFFLEVDVGISESDTPVPPRGTRFNYLAQAGGGVTISLQPGVHLLAAMRWTHVSNGGFAGRDRNPDIEAVGPQVGLLLGF